MQSVSKMLGQYFRGKFPTPKAGKEFISTYVRKHLGTAPKFNRHQPFRFLFVGTLKTPSIFSSI
jgi:hypothetical protein